MAMDTSTMIIHRKYVCSLLFIILHLSLLKQTSTYQIVPPMYYLSRKPFARIKPNIIQVNLRHDVTKTFGQERIGDRFMSEVDSDGYDDDCRIEDDEEEIEYGKFAANDETTQPSPPSSSSGSTATKTTITSDSTKKEDETKIQIEQQQRQIDMLIEMMKNQQQQQQQQPNQTPPSSKQPTPKNDESTTTLPPPLPGMFDELPSEDELLDYNDDDQSFSTFYSQQQTPSPGATNSADGSVVPPLAPLKAMLFIDGTWLYYSLHRRSEDRDPIVKKFGRGWQHRYRFDWNALPRIVCEVLVQQQRNLGWTATGSPETITNNAHTNNINLQAQRPMEIVRASVFTSYKKTTDPNSFRVKMYNEMANANYDLHMLESVGNGPEKCVDISLAVEMLHYATVPNAYDVAILLSGDKDFIPALVRTRQKGRKVGIVSMKAGCNRALYESPHIKDFDVVWIDDFLDQLLVPLPPDQVNSIVESVHDRGLLSAFTITKVIYEFISNSPFDRVSSRDIGRYLKGLEIKDGTTLLDDVKLGQGGLRRFLQDRMPEVFEVIDKTPSERMGRDFNDKSYWIAVKPNAGEVMLNEAKTSTFTEEEKQFLKDYRSKLSDKYDLKEEVYYYTIDSTAENVDFASNGLEEDTSLSSSYSMDQEDLETNKRNELSKLTVPALKEMCRERNLYVSGTKAILIERIISDIQTKFSVESTHEEKVEDPISKYLEDLVKYYISQSSGLVTSRDLGRFLATNKAYQSHSLSALQELKENYGGVASFLNQRTEIFTIVRDHNNEPGDSSDNYNFGIKLKGKAVRRSHSNPQTSPEQNQTFSSANMRSQSRHINSKISDHIEALIKEYLKARGGIASSRDIGRYLAANAALIGSGHIKTNHGRRLTALQQMKDNYGSLASYISSKADTFVTVSGRLVESSVDGPPSQHTFGVQLR